jgi:hypothetical protein
MFHPKHVEPFTGNKILYKKKCHLVGTLKKKANFGKFVILLHLRYQCHCNTTIYHNFVRNVSTSLEMRYLQSGVSELEYSGT